jgi:hypothetical protein
LRVEGDLLALFDVDKYQSAVKLALVEEIIHAVFRADEPEEAIPGEFLDGANHDVLEELLSLLPQLHEDNKKERRQRG